MGKISTFSLKEVWKACLKGHMQIKWLKVNQNKSSISSLLLGPTLWPMPTGACSQCGLPRPQGAKVDWTSSPDAQHQEESTPDMVSTIPSLGSRTWQSHWRVCPTLYNLVPKSHSWLEMETYGSQLFRAPNFWHLWYKTLWFQRGPII